MYLSSQLLLDIGTARTLICSQRLAGVNECEKLRMLFLRLVRQLVTPLELLHEGGTSSVLSTSVERQN